MIEYHFLPQSNQDPTNLARNFCQDFFADSVIMRRDYAEEDILVADTEELENLDASKIRARRLNAKEVLFPIANGTVNLISNPGSPCTEWRAYWWFSKTIGQVSADRDNDGSQTIARNDLWSIEGNFICRDHAEPRIKLYVPEEESLPIPVLYIDVVRRTHTTLDVLPESHAEDYWNVDGDRNLSEPYAGFTQFTTLNEKPPDGHTWSGERLTTIHATSAPDKF